MNEHSEQKVKDVWESGGAYESFMGRWSRLVAVEFLQWLSVPARSRWLDVGCGTGILSQTILESADLVKVRGIDQAQGFISFARLMFVIPGRLLTWGQRTLSNWGQTPMMQSYPALC